MGRALVLVKKNNPILSTVAEGVEHGTDLKQLICRMFGIIHLYDGHGLAANQVGILKRVIVLSIPFIGEQAIINPIITKRYSHTAKKKESCLSYPGLSVSKRRSTRIIVEGFNEDWDPVKFKLKGLNAQVVQHEIDHLNGKTIGNGK